MNKGLKHLIITFVSGLAVYAWLGFLLVPSIALKVINQQLAVYANSPAHLQRLEFNPFSLELSAWDFLIDPADDQQISLQHLYGQLALDSLWSKTLHLRNVQLVQPQLQVIFDAKGTLNLTELFTLPSPTEPSEPSDSAPLAVLIDQLQLQQGSLRFNDQRQQEPIDVTLADLNIDLKHLDTRPDSQSDLQLSAQANDGSQLHWQGDFSLSPLASTGHLQLQDVRLKSWWPYVQEHLSAQLNDGRLNFATDYALTLSPALQFQASELSIQLQSLVLEHQQQPLARLGNLSISQTSFDLAQQKVQIGKISSSQLTAWTEIDKEGVSNWQKLVAQPQTEASSHETDMATADKQQPNSTPAWQIIVKQADLTEHQLHLTDHSKSDPVALQVSNLNVHLKDFDSQANTPFSAELDAQIGEQGKLSSQAQVLLQPLTIDMSINSSDLDLRPAQAWISPYAHLELRSGLLSSALQLKISDTDNLQLAVQGNAAISQLHLRDSLQQRDLLKWQNVDVNGINYALQQQKLSIDKLILQQPYVRFIINENLTTNISQLLIPQPISATEPTQTKGPEFALKIGGIDIKDGSANFADFSLTPNFATAIQQLDGSIGTLNNQSNAVAKVDIKGNVDRYAPVTIKGSLSPFDPLKKLDIATAFKHVELTTLTPYSGKFAGYRIQKGRLNLDLHYQINDGKLNATNKLLLEQLQLGEQVESPDAVDLPIRLAIALLKDSKGQISIDLPVQGDLNNPEFSVAPIIWQTLRNLITRAVSAPFNFIAGLANGDGNELNEVAFLAGSTDITSAAAKNLDNLASALKERPQLRLEVEGSSLAEQDGPVLAELLLTAAYQNAWYSILQRRGTKIGSSKDTLEVPEKEQTALLEGIYRAQLKQQPPAEWKDLAKEERQQRMRSAVLDSYANNPLGLRRLAQARASSIKAYLIEQGQLDPERIYLIDVSTGKTNAEQEVISTLHLGSM